MIKKILSVSLASLVGLQSAFSSVPGVRAEQIRLVEEDISARAEVMTTNTPMIDLKAGQGLIAYYFKNEPFKNEQMITSIRPNGDLSIHGYENIQAAEFQGELKPVVSGEYSFTIESSPSSMSKVRMWILNDRNEKVRLVGNDNERGTPNIFLKSDKQYPLLIKVQNDKESAAFSRMKLKWTVNHSTETVPQGHLLLPSKHSDPWHNHEAEPRNAVHSINKRDTSRMDEAIESDHIVNQPVTVVSDYDKDKIPNELEKNGYYKSIGADGMIHLEQAAPEMKKEYRKTGKGKKIYHSNMYLGRTGHDPYTDLEKVMGVEGIDRNASDPRLSVYPIIDVNVIGFMISKIQEESWTSGSSKSTNITKATSTSHTDSFTEGLDIKAGLFDFSVDASFSATQSSTATVDNSNSNGVEKSWSETIGINTGHAAYFAPYIQMSNRGLAASYNTSPTLVVNIGRQSILTLTKIPALEANSIVPGATYPASGGGGISIATKDSFGSSPIELSLPQFENLEKSKKLKILTTQVSGNVDDSPAHSLSKQNPMDSKSYSNSWEGYIDAIKQNSARITLAENVNGKEVVIERRVIVTSGSDDLSIQDAVPEMTVKDALLLAFKQTRDMRDKGLTGTEIASDGSLLVNGKKLDDFIVIKDKFTNDEFERQLQEYPERNKLDLELHTGMDILIKAKIKNSEDKSLRASFGYHPDQDTINHIVASIYNVTNPVQSVQAIATKLDGTEKTLTFKQDIFDASKWIAYFEPTFDLTQYSLYKLIAKYRDNTTSQPFVLSAPEGVIKEEGMTFVQSFVSNISVNTLKTDQRFKDAKSVVLQLQAIDQGRSIHRSLVEGNSAYAVDFGVTDDKVHTQNQNTARFYMRDYDNLSNLFSFTNEHGYDGVGENLGVVSRYRAGRGPLFDSLFLDPLYSAPNNNNCADKIYKATEIRDRALGLIVYKGANQTGAALGVHHPKTVLSDFGFVNNISSIKYVRKLETQRSPIQTTIAVVPIDQISHHCSERANVLGYYTDKQNTGDKFTLTIDRQEQMTNIDGNTHDYQLGQGTENASAYVIQVTSEKISSEQITVEFNGQVTCELGSADTHAFGHAMGAVSYGTNSDESENNLTYHSPTRSDIVIVPALSNKKGILSVKTTIGNGGHRQQNSKVKVKLIGYYSQNGTLCYQPIDPINLQGFSTDNGTNQVVLADEFKNQTKNNVPKAYVVKVTAVEAGSDLMNLTINQTMADFATSPTQYFNGLGKTSNPIEPVRVTRSTIMVVDAQNSSTPDGEYQFNFKRTIGNWKRNGNYHVTILGYYHE